MRLSNVAESRLMGRIASISANLRVAIALILEHRRERPSAHCRWKQIGTRCGRMKRDGLLRYLRPHGCVIRRKVKNRLQENPQTGHAEAVPRHVEIANLLAKRICRRLSIPDPRG